MIQRFTFAIQNNKLVKVDPNGSTTYEVKDYIKNITAIKVDGQALGGRKANISEIAKSVFNESTGAVNFDAKVNNTAVFAKGDGGSYECRADIIRIQRQSQVPLHRIPVNTNTYTQDLHGNSTGQQKVFTKQQTPPLLRKKTDVVRATWAVLMLSQEQLQTMVSTEEVSRQWQLFTMRTERPMHLPDGKTKQQ